MNLNEALRLRTNARHAFTHHAHSREETDDLVRANCDACVLRGHDERVGQGPGGLSAGPNHAGWARLYVEAGRVIPAEWASAFASKLLSGDPLDQMELRRSVEHFGAVFGGAK